MTTTTERTVAAWGVHSSPVIPVYPVVLGDGLRLFPQRGQTHDLTLLESRSAPSGVMIQTYRLTGRATFGNVAE